MLEVVREVPLPSLEELGGYLPSQRFPSDHLPVVFDLRFRAEGAAAAVPTGGSSAAAAAGGGAAAAGGGAAAGGEGGQGSQGAPRGASNVLPAGMYNVGAAAEALGRDEVLAVPTDTLYGLAACANSSRAVAHIYATKRRADTKPLAVCVADVADVGRYGDTSVSVLLLGAAGRWCAPAVCCRRCCLCSCMCRPRRSLRVACLPGPCLLIVAQASNCTSAAPPTHATSPTYPPQHLPEGLVEELLPGPYTLLLRRLPHAPLAAELNPGVGNIGVRVPDAPFIRAVARQHRSALALTSANVSGGLSSISVEEFEVGS